MTEVLLSERSRDRLSELEAEFESVSKTPSERSIRNEISRGYLEKIFINSVSETIA